MTYKGPDKIEPAYGDVRTTCARYGWGKTLTYELLRDQKIRAVKCGRKTLIEFASVEEYLTTLPTFGRGQAGS
ncbi:excisionase family DNA-binding protein [Novosphingobium sp. SL115]|uniref:excisionase family DNA-binding protein n=1 Tax=Novosphingobium sp. SL115 TaxID=2995150 RepID=UPI0022736257|nr:excisionase family DNA-binding protein [Novosphingobium sp. SL115]MCY1670190.1 excisionase family DNA-binding protein [Novosphingobium sp. SL115]